MLEFGVINNAGFTVITGEIGSGKTTLVRYLLRRLDPESASGVISNTPQGRDELLQWIMMSLGQPFDGSYPPLFRRFQDYLYAPVRRQAPHHPDHRRGAEPADWTRSKALRMLSNVNVDKDQFLQLILVGQPQLKDLLVRAAAACSSRSAFRRTSISRRSNCGEVAQYINHRLSAVGLARAAVLGRGLRADRPGQLRHSARDQHSVRHRAGLRLRDRGGPHHDRPGRRGHRTEAQLRHLRPGAAIVRAERADIA